MFYNVLVIGIETKIPLYLIHQIDVTIIQLFVINERCQIVGKISSLEIEEWIGELPIYKTSCDL